MSLTSRRTAMARKRYKPEEIVAKLRQVDVLVSQGQGMTEAIRQIGVSEVTYYRWPAAWLRLRPSQRRPRHTGATSLARPQKHPTHGSLYRTFACPLPRLLEGEWPL